MDEQNRPEKSPQENGTEQQDLVLDLNFTPDWARQAPANPYAGRDDFEEREDRKDRRGGGGGRGGFRRDGDRRGGGGGFHRDRNGGSGGGRSGAPQRPGEGRTGGFSREGGGSAGPRREGGGGFRGPGRPGEGSGVRREGGGGGARGGFHRGPGRDGDRRGPRETLPRMDVKVTFLPDRERLSLVVRDIQASRRAFPLLEIANRFLGREDLYLVKLELPPPREGKEKQTFAQCLECKRVFRSRANAEAHVLNEHMDKFFDVEEVETEPPTGVFTCVARCRLSGVLLGPPNYHGYNEKLQELWSSRFAHMPKTEYLGHIETVRDEALVEQWKDSLRKKTIYRLKDLTKKPETAPASAPAEATTEAAATATPDGASAETPVEEVAAVETPVEAAAERPALTKREAQEWMHNKVNGLLRESSRCVVPGTQARKVDDPALRREISMAWQRETRFPLTLTLALRPAFRHMHLHLFKVNARETYVTAVAPAPVDLATAPDIVKEIVAFLGAHPGSTRQQLLEGMRAGADPESKEASELLLHLGSLVANGGVIEFFNSTLVLPRAGAPKEAPKTEGKEAPAAESAATEDKAETEPEAVAASEEAPAVPVDVAAAPEAEAAPAPVEESSAEIVSSAAEVPEVASSAAEAADASSAERDSDLTAEVPEKTE